MRFASPYLSVLGLSIMLATIGIYVTGQSVPATAPMPRMDRPPDVQLPIIVDQPRNRAQSFDPAELRELTKSARELLELSQSIPLDIERLNRGVLNQDVLAKLKRIEKLSKHLRSQIYR